MTAPKGILADPKRLISIGAGLLAYALIVFIDSPLHHFGKYGDRPAYAAGATALMAIWWLTEAVSIYRTACVPLILFPLTSVLSDVPAENIKRTLLPYVDPYIFLFMGGMGIAAAMHQWGLHRRFALHIMHRVGTDPKRLLLGVLASTAFISMWISNTATAAMMFPIGMALIEQFEDRAGGKRLTNYGAAIMLAIAYGANIGGIGTKIGTAPNAMFSQYMSVHGTDVSFLQFAAVGFPFVVIFIPFVWRVLIRVGKNDPVAQDVGDAIIDQEIKKLPPVQRAEMIVLAVFGITSGLWIVAQPICELIKESLPNLAIRTAHVEGAVGVLAMLSLMVIRSDGDFVLARRSLKAQPWESLLLLGGSFAMAEGIQQSGLSEYLGAQIAFLRELTPFAQVLAASVTAVALSAVASNTATIAIMLNLLGGIVQGPHLNTVLFSTTISTSCDFALPAGTPPNAIVFGSGYLTVRRMAKTGVVLDAAAAVLSAVWCWMIVRFVF